MAVKTQQAGIGLALAGSRKKGDDLTTSAGGVNITGNDICEEFGHSGSDQSVAGSNINIGSYHTDTGSGGLVPAAGNTSGLIAGAANAEKQFSDYFGGAAISAPTTFGINQLGFNTTQSTFSGTSIFSEAFFFIQFQHLSAQNKIRIAYASGTSASPTTTYYTDYNYVGLSSATWQVRYNVTSLARTGDSVPATSGCFQGSFGATPVQDGYNSGTYYTLSGTSYITFGWMAYANPNVPPCSGSGTVIGGFPLASSSTRAFQIKGTLGNDTFEAHAVDSVFGQAISGEIALSAGTNLPVPV